MPTFNITISDEHANLIMAAVQDYNERNGTSLTGEQWVKRVLKVAVLGSQIEAALTNRRNALNRQMATEAPAIEQGLLDQI